VKKNLPVGSEQCVIAQS